MKPFTIKLIIDAAVHLVLYTIIAYTSYLSGLSPLQSFIIFLVGIGIDVDHVIHPYLKKRFPGKRRVYKVLHGLDLTAIATLILIAMHETLFGLFVFITLLTHMFWDNLWWHYRWQALFLSTKIYKSFNNLILP